MAKTASKRGAGTAAAADSEANAISSRSKGKAPADPAKLASKLRNAKRALRRARAGKAPAAAPLFDPTSLLPALRPKLYH